MNFGRIFASAIVRKLAYVLVALVLGWIGMGHAYASTDTYGHDTTSCATINGAWCNSKAAAIAAAQASAEFQRQSDGASLFTMCAPTTTISADVHPVDTTVRFFYTWHENTCGPGVPQSGAAQRRYHDGPDPMCQDKPHSGFASGDSLSMCKDGCEYNPVGGHTSVLVPGGMIIQASDWGPSGNTCGLNNNKPPEDKPQECAQPTGGGMTVCLKKNGQHCYTSDVGKQTCWGPGETGEKTDGPVLQKRDSGDNAIVPNLNLPNGDTLVKGPSVTTNSTTNNTTTTTTTTNYNSSHGTNAGPGPGSGEKGDGTGDKPDDKDKGSTSGGSTCFDPPTSSGDPVTGGVLSQVWKLRCDGTRSGTPIPEEDASSGVTGSWDSSGVTGSWDEDPNEDFEHGADPLQGARDSKSFADIALDESGFLGGGTCPVAASFSVANRAFQLPFTHLCETLINVGGLVMALAYILAFRMITTA